MAEANYTNFQSVGIGNVGSYQVAGGPYITGSSTSTVGDEFKISFPAVTKKIIVIASGSNSNIRVHFASKDEGDGGAIAGEHFIELDDAQGTIDSKSFTFDVKCKELFITSRKTGSGFKIYAELTRIPVSQMYPVSGSGVNEYT
jgi:hypothetical protein